VRSSDATEARLLKLERRRWLGLELPRATHCGTCSSRWAGPPPAPARLATTARRRPGAFAGRPPL